MQTTHFQWITLGLQSRSQISSVQSSHHREPKKLQKLRQKRNHLKFRRDKRGSQVSQKHLERIQEINHLRLKNSILHTARKTDLKLAPGQEQRDLTFQIKKVRALLRKLIPCQHLQKVLALDVHSL